MKITGRTPLISIDDDGRIWAKLETHNRTGSVKDRMIEYILDRAVLENTVTPGATQIVEATSGNTGIALSSYAASLGCPCTIIMPCNNSGYYKPEIAARYGVADFDWSNAKDQWANAQPMDCEERLLAQARIIKQINPATKVWVYRNLVKVGVQVAK